MTVGIAAARANAFLDDEYGTVYVQLHTGDPGASGTANASAGDTSRKQATMGSASGGVKSMSSMSGPWTNGGTSETISHCSLWSASTSGTFLRSAEATTPKAWATGDTIAFSSLGITVSDLAA